VDECKPLLSDPCPLPSTEKKQRKLDEKQKLLYAPMSDVGGLLYDKDAVYISMVGCCVSRRRSAPVCHVSMDVLQR